MQWASLAEAWLYYLSGLHKSRQLQGLNWTTIAKLIDFEMGERLYTGGACRSKYDTMIRNGSWERWPGQARAALRDHIAILFPNIPINTFSIKREHMTIILESTALSTNVLGPLQSGEVIVDFRMQSTPLLAPLSTAGPSRVEPSPYLLSPTEPYTTTNQGVDGSVDVVEYDGLWPPNTSDQAQFDPANGYYLEGFLV